MAARKKTFEESMARLTEIVSKLETGEVGLEESMSLYEEGMKLSAACAGQLDKAEQKIAKLSKSPEGTPIEHPFSEESA